MDARLAFETDGLSGLEEYERAMLWALRCVAAGRLDCPSLRRAFEDICGRAGDQLLCGLLVMVRLLAGRGEAELRLHLPGSSVMSLDERAVVSALARLKEGAGAEAVTAELAARLGVAADDRLTAAVRYVAELLAGEAASAPLLSARTVH